VVSNRSKNQSGAEEAPFGAIASTADDGAPSTRRGRSRTRAATQNGAAKDDGGGGASDAADGSDAKDWRKPAKRRGNGRRGGRRRRRAPGDEPGEADAEGTDAPAERSGAAADAEGPARSDRNGRSDGDAGGAANDGLAGPRSRRRRRRRKGGEGAVGPGDGTATDERATDADAPTERPQRKGGGQHGSGGQHGAGGKGGNAKGRSRGGKPKPQHQQQQGGKGAKPKDGKKDTRGGTVTGILITDKGGHGKIRTAERGYHGDRTNDVHVGPKWITKHQLREGMLLECRYGKGMGKHKWDITELISVDGEAPDQRRKVPEFKKLTSIDPDFQYEVGDLSQDTTMRVVDLICPVGRGQRGLIVAPPRSGKTVLLKTFAKCVEEHYPDVHLMVLLVDERPEEATDWQRTIDGDVFVSTNDEMPKTHVDIAEVVWKRAMRLVELGEDVIVLLDSITRLARAYNHVKGDSGKTMSGGLDAKAMERPKQFFGSARNTETAGSLTILGTALIETGSRMDQVIFEEFKGTGNMELVLSRKLADRRIFPAIDVERSGTRKEEKLLSSTRLRRVQTLRRVLSRMHFAEAMELLSTKLDDVERNDDFLKRFDVDPEA